MKIWSTSQIAGVVRFIIIPTGGAVGFAHEVFWTAQTREVLVLICGAMMGLPLPSLADWFKNKSEIPTVRPNEDGVKL